MQLVIKKKEKLLRGLPLPTQLLLILGLLVSCAVPPQNRPQSTHSASQTSINLSTTIERLVSPTPSPSYKISFFSKHDAQYDLQVLDVEGLQTDKPSFINPIVLFSITGHLPDLPGIPVLESVWSPNGQQIAINASGNKGRGDIFVGDWTGKQWQNLTNTPNNEWQPTWSDGGQKIMYASATGDPNNVTLIYSRDLNGNDKEQLLTKLDPSTWIVKDFSLSPVGNRIVFACSDNQGFYQLYISDLDGGNLKQLTNDAKDHIHPVFSPDGQWILYLNLPQRGQTVSDLYLIRNDGTEEKAVPESKFTWKQSQSWSPDGQWILFTAKDKDIFQVYVIRPDGSGLLPVLPSNMNEYLPAWRVTLQ